MNDHRNDRRLFVTGVALLMLAPRRAVAQPAASSVASLSMGDLRGLVGNPGAMEKLLQEMDLTCSVAALSQSRRTNEPPPPDARAAYFQIRAFLTLNQRQALIAAVQAADAERIARAAASVRDVLPALQKLLAEGGLQPSGPLMDQLLRAFTTFTQLVSLAPNNDRWWCRCYGLRGALLRRCGQVTTIIRGVEMHRGARHISKLCSHIGAYQLVKRLFDSAGRDPEIGEPEGVLRRHAVDFHQLHLAARQGRPG